MKNIRLFILSILLLFPFFAHAQDGLDAALPLLQKATRNTAENRQVFELFSKSRNANLTFAAGASLVRLPPDASQELALYNVLIKNEDMLKKVFAAVILTAMGGTHEELATLLSDATQSKDNAIRSYAASAYVTINPNATAYADDVVNLYIYDTAFAQRAMNLLASSPKQLFKYVKQASANSDPQVRAAAATWLGDLQTKEAASVLLKMAKSEQDPPVRTAIATALAKNKNFTLEAVSKGLDKNYQTDAANTYALALGFMTGDAIDTLRKNLNAPGLNQRVNAARACAYMAGVLASPDAAAYSSDPAFDTQLLKSLIARLTEMLRKDSPSVKVYADNALKQIGKLN